jgi:hypothetical protein
MRVKTKETGFYITGKKGFHITFENGYTVSVQFGPGNYCENRDMDIGAEEEMAGRAGSANAEVAWWGPDGEMIKFEEDEYADTVKGWMRPADVLALLNRAASMSSAKVGN